jgi:recombination associated protein RdgC
MGAIELIQQKAFLGKEFLTWLWFRSETEPVIDISGGRAVEIEILGPLLLDANYGDARSTALKGESAGLSAEAGTALREGKKFKRARVKFNVDGVEWIASLDGETLAITGLAVPSSGKLPFSESLRLRTDFILDFESLLTELLNLFLERRLDEKSWAAELKKIHAWALEKA